MKNQSEWGCVRCGHVLGNIFGGEFYPSIEGKFLRTNGPNLVATCPSCSQSKTFYTSDPVVRSLFQLIDAISAEAAKAMIREMGKAVNNIKTGN